MGNVNTLTFLVGLTILNIIAFTMGNTFLSVPAWLNCLLIANIIICAIFLIYSKKKNYENVGVSIGILLNIFLLILLTASLILHKSS